MTKSVSFAKYSVFNFSRTRYSTQSSMGPLRCTSLSLQLSLFRQLNWSSTSIVHSPHLHKLIAKNENSREYSGKPAYGFAQPLSLLSCLTFSFANCSEFTHLRLSTQAAFRCNLFRHCTSCLTVTVVLCSIAFPPTNGGSYAKCTCLNCPKHPQQKNREFFWMLFLWTVFFCHNILTGQENPILRYY